MSSSSQTPSRSSLLLHDVILIGIMAVLAACGLIYEYLLSHYAGRVLGAVESAIYAMIGIMIVSMGIGAFAARAFKCPFNAFAWLEAIVALLGMSSVLIVAALIALVNDLPNQLSQIFNLPPDIILNGLLIQKIKTLVAYSPYFAGFVLGALIGMEIPLIARVRQHVYGVHLENNAGTIYGADYIGAGVGAAIWVKLMLSMEITQAAVLTALLNLIAGAIFLWRYFDRVKFGKTLIGFHLILIGILLVIAQNGQQWMLQFTNVLYQDQVIYSANTNYQHVAITERSNAPDQQKNLDLYLNGRLQFSSSDEHIYHSMLTYPALAASARQQNILIIGGGDGLGLRDVLQWQPQQVTLIDLDGQLVELFTHDPAVETEQQALKQRLSAINQHAFSDPRLKLIIGDAFIEIDQLLAQQRTYDSIIVDLPDPSHPDLNKLYSDFFYSKLRHLLNADGAIVVQSTSPYHARSAFISIGKTLVSAGFAHVEQYRQNVPSFGEWGWSIATKTGQAPSARLKQLNTMPQPHRWLSLEMILAAFVFPADFYQQQQQIQVNSLGSSVLFNYHYQAWRQDQGLHLSHDTTNQ